MAVNEVPTPTPCVCVEREICHFCKARLDDSDIFNGGDDIVWCDWVITSPENGSTHILAHFGCADGREGVERG